MKKITKGQFFTVNTYWLKPHIIDFIKSLNVDTIYDPFAGKGDIFKIKDIVGIDKTKGLDIDAKLGWELNDSLITIPKIDNSIIITNPPYLSKTSASRKKLLNEIKEYFNNSEYIDLYLIALTRMLESNDNVIAIIPETFINSNFKQFNKLSSITILEENLFDDTSVPICIVCFDGIEKEFKNIKIYKNDKYLFTLQEMNDLRLRPKNNVNIEFNTLDGWLGLVAIDGTDIHNKIRFDFKENIKYNWEKYIKISSRTISLIDIDVLDKQKFIDECNDILNDFRKNTQDVILSPFKGNNKKSIRRRRLDFYTARAIMEIAYHNIQKC